VDEQELIDVFNKGIEAFRRGDNAQAINLLTKVVEEKENDPRSWNALGVAFAKSGKYSDADICFQNAVTLDPENEVYIKNRNKNINYLPKNSKKRISDLIELIKENKSNRYAIGGLIGVFLLIVLLVIIPPILFPAPMADTAGVIPINISTDEEMLVITNSGSLVPKLSAFQITADNQTIKIDEKVQILGVEPGSALSIPLEKLRPYSSDNRTTIRASAIFKDDSTRQLMTRTVVIPPNKPVNTPEPTPTPVPYTPKLKPGDLLLVKDKDIYLLISDILPDEKYKIIPFSRQSDGLFQVMKDIQINTSMRAIEESSIITDLTLSGSSFEPDSLHQGDKKENVSKDLALPIYKAGDLIAQTQSARSDQMVILGYDAGTDEYATDILYPYYNGEWGYRKDKIIKWKPRTDIETDYPYRTLRIALYSIGIGADSSPPGSPVLYHTGDIIAKDQSADAELLVILSYNEDTNKYETDTIRRTYDGKWYKTGNSSFVTRSLLEKEFTYRVRTIDITLLN